MKTDVKLPGEPTPNGSKETKPEAKSQSVPLDFNKKSATEASPFKKAISLERRLKAFFWGDAGVGKTKLALQFSKPAVMDTEGGCDLYGDQFKFDVLKATTADEVMEGVDWLLTHKHDYRTLVIDPITIYWDALQKKWSDIFLKRNKGSKGHKFEFYDLQPKDWLTIKAEFKELMRKLIALDMNVIVTARQKTQYADGAFMKAIGETFDGERSLPYLFDTIVKLYFDEKGRHMAVCLKDRSDKLPKEPFPAEYKVFESVFGKDALTRKAKPIVLASSEQKVKIQASIELVGMSPEQVSRRLASYGVETIDELTAENAEIILKKLEAAVASKQQTPA